MIKILEKIINLIYPPVCSICGKVNSKPLCNKCRYKLKEELYIGYNNYLADTDKNFIEHYYFFKYKSIIREQILDLKFHEKPYISQTITYFLKNMQKSFENLKKYDIIIIVPISTTRQKERGYNQSELIAKQISMMINIPIENKILYKTKNNLQQSTLSKENRIKNVKGVYTIKNCHRIQNKKILLIDDIYTTGSTVNECSKTLIANGVSREHIGVLTLAKD